MNLDLGDSPGIANGPRLDLQALRALIRRDTRWSELSDLALAVVALYILRGAKDAYDLHKRGYT